MGTLHLIQGSIMLLFTADAYVPITTDFFKFVEGVGSVPNTETLVEVPLGPMIALFMFMSAIAHFSVSHLRVQMVCQECEQGH